MVAAVVAAAAVLGAHKCLPASLMIRYQEVCTAEDMSQW